MDNTQVGQFDYSKAIHSTVHAKAKRDEELSNIIVEVDDGNGGKLAFDADKESRDLMSQAIAVSKASGRDKGPWKLADNSVVEVTLDQLQMAIGLGLDKHGEILFKYS